MLTPVSGGGEGKGSWTVGNSIDVWDYKKQRHKRLYYITLGKVYTYGEKLIEPCLVMSNFIFSQPVLA